MAEFDINGTLYKSELMDGDVQALVLKRLLPTITTLISLKDQISELRNEDGSLGGNALASLSQDVLTPAARELAALSDADVQFILNTCMNVTQRKIAVGVGWAPVIQRGLVQDQTDKKFITRVMIAWHVLSENFGSILASFGVDLSGLPAPKFT